MKTLVFVLVLANLLFLAFTEGYFGRPGNPDAVRVDQQVAAERIRVVSRGEPPGEPKQAKAPALPPPPPSAPPEDGCIAWGGLAAPDADRLSALLAEKFDGFRQSRRQVASEGGSWWVFISALATKVDAEKKAGELERLGVSDYYVLQEAGSSRYAISLGVFSAESGAQERLQELKGKGVKSAKAGPRPGRDALHVIEAMGPTDRQDAIRAAVAEVLPRAQTQSCL